ncbi:MAG TPA: hypothetical protein VEZ40_12910 [Pyrinomonadaceae bacterium]|nr:hypothetical protein [Pyrinomonadaceae bacterium]
MKAIPKFSLLSLALFCVLTLGVASVSAQPARGKAAPAAPATPALPPAIPARPVADKLAPAGWTRYEIGRPTRFSLILPGAPSGSAERMILTPKITLTVRHYMSLGESGLYGATYIDDLPAGIMNAAMKRAFFEEFVKGFAEGFQTQMSKAGTTGQVNMLEQRAATAAGLAGYEQDFAFDQMTGRVRLVYDGARAYAVLSFWSDPATDGDRIAFFDSLRVNRGR